MFLNAAVIGLGVGEQHLRGLKENSKIKIIKIFDKNQKRMSDLAKKYDVYGCKKIEEILNDKKIDVVCIASNDDSHFDYIKKCLNKNKHIFVEKPALINHLNARKIFKILKEKKKIFFYSNYILRKSKRFMKLKRMIEKKEFGNIYYFEGDYNYGRINKIISGWRGKI